MEFINSEKNKNDLQIYIKEFKNNFKTFKFFKHVKKLKIKKIIS